MSDVQQHLGHAASYPRIVAWEHLDVDRKGRAVGKRELVKPKRVAKRRRRGKKTL